MMNKKEIKEDKIVILIPDDKNGNIIKIVDFESDTDNAFCELIRKQIVLLKEIDDYDTIYDLIDILGKFNKKEIDSMRGILEAIDMYNNICNYGWEEIEYYFK